MFHRRARRTDLGAIHTGTTAPPPRSTQPEVAARRQLEHARNQDAQHAIAWADAAFPGGAEDLGLPSLRSPRMFGALQRAIARASVDRFRVIHFWIHQDHGHFLVEGDEPRRARGGVHGLAIRLALAVNRVLGRKGRVVGDRRRPWMARAVRAGRPFD